MRTLIIFLFLLHWFARVRVASECTAGADSETCTADCPNKGILEDACNPASPATLLLISYVDHISLVCGSTLTGDEARNQPFVKYASADSDKLYVLLMIDPDAPSRANPIKRSWRHWIMSGISGENLKSGEHLDGNFVTAYAGPTPPTGSGPHRYQFYLYEQSSTEGIVGGTRKDRGSFDVENFAKENSLGCFVASFQFLVENK